MTSTVFGTISNIQFTNTRMFDKKFLSNSYGLQNASYDKKKKGKPNWKVSPAGVTPSVSYDFGTIRNSSTGSESPSMEDSPHGSYVSIARPKSDGMIDTQKSPNGIAFQESSSGSLRFATDRPHLVSMGSGRLSTSVTLHPINEGKTILGSGGMGVVPDIPVLGTGVEPEHCLLENKDGVVHLTPMASMVSVDGVRITSVTRLVQGCMLCLGRSNFFRFNHPAEAKLFRSILPNARISMAPIAFYPAVDNPEYFHMSAQDAGLGEGAAVTTSGDEGTKDINKPPVALRNTPPSTLALYHNKDESPKNFNDKIFKFDRISSDTDKIASEKSTSEASDSDEPPEVPPRSEASDSGFSPSIVQSGGSSSSNNYLGDYICTKSEESCSPTSFKDLLPSSPNGLKPSIGCSNGMTAVHNLLYKSLPETSSSPDSNLPKIFTFNTSSSYSGSLQRTAQPMNVSSSQKYPTATHSYMNTPMAPRSIAYPIGPPPVYPKEKNSVEDLNLTEAKKQQALNDRIREQQDAAEEQVRLEEILTMCAEYERQQHKDTSAAYRGDTATPTVRGNVNTSSNSEDVSSRANRRSTSPPQSWTQNRIKTNGSLPRDKRSPVSPSRLGLKSPAGSLPTSPSARAASEDELTTIFKFDGNQERNNSLNRNENLCPYPPFPSMLSGSSPSPPPATPRSPYENVGSPTNGCGVPQSPRTRIRTTFSKDRKDGSCEIFENKMVVAEDVTKDKSRKSFDDLSVPARPPRSPRIERGILDSTEDSSFQASVINNKYFAPVTPKANKSSTSDICSDQSSLFSSGSYNCDLSLNLDSKFRNKVFEEHMLKNIQESLNVEDVGGEIERLKSVKDKAIQATMDLKAKICELESLENEAMRELEMERALVEGELRSTRDKLSEEQECLNGLFIKSDQMEVNHERDRKNDQEAIQTCKLRLEEAEETLEKMEEPNGSDGARALSASTDEEKEMLEILKAQHETVDAEKKFFLFYIRWKRWKKIFEDTEFSQMESEALRESEREEINKEIADLTEKIEFRKGKIEELELQMSQMTISVCRETEVLEKDRQELIQLINKERMRVSAVDRQFLELERLGIMSPDGGPDSPSCSSDSEEGSSSELSQKLAELHLLDRSQDDLDRINQVTMTSALDCRDSSLGRKTSATLMEIEKNRQLLLAKQGTKAIDQERRRVEELKRRVAQEVKSQWEEKKAREQREVNCASLNSIGSEDSSMTSSDLHTESLSSDDIIGQRISGDSVTKALKMRQRDADNSVPSDQMRPLSDASSFCDSELNSVVKFRDKPRNQQRPLTRYLPIRSEENFDLRQHIESAGHQIELCSSIILSPISCRGYLHKLGSKFRTWQKRWFVFDRSKRALIYYSDKSESKPKGGAYFQSIEEVYVDHLHTMKSANAKLIFCVKTHDRIFQLMAPSPEAMRIWIDVIFTGAEAYNEFGT